MDTSSLQDKCYSTLAKNMQQFPPVLQEMIMGETLEHVKEDMKKEVQQLVKKELKEALIFLIPKMISDIVINKSNPYRIPCNFYQLYYKMFDKSLIQFAYTIVENSIQKIDHYHMNLLTDYDNTQYNNTNEDNWDSDESSEIDYPDSD